MSAETMTIVGRSLPVPCPDTPCEAPASDPAVRPRRAELRPRRTGGWRKAALATALGLMATAGAVGYVSVGGAGGPTQVTAGAGALETSIRTVRVASAEMAGDASLTLPASVRPYQQTELRARVNGYLRRWKVDRGDRVHAGQVLAEIDTPELDQDVLRAEAAVRQARAEAEQSRAESEEAAAAVELAVANVERARANLDYAGIELSRSRKLVARQSASREELDSASKEHETRKAELAAARAELVRSRTNLSTRRAIIASRDAIVHSREAELGRLRELQGFKSIVAPFDGVVTRRDAEAGMLVAAGDGVEGRPLFSLVEDDRLRVVVAVPQAVSASIRSGDAARLRVPERPGQTFDARVARTAGAVEPDSRTLAIELDIENREGLLLPGSYAQVELHATRGDRAPTVPASVLLMRPEGPSVAVVEPGGTIRLRPVRLGRDMGTRVEVLEGISARDRLVVNPTDDLRDGERVAVAKPSSEGGEAPVEVASR